MQEYFKSGDKGPTLRAKFNQMWDAFQEAIANAVGPRGWSPVLAAELHAGRSVLRVIDWAGGEGTKPTITGYIGLPGIVATAAEAIDVRGQAGANGANGANGADGAPGLKGDKGDKGDKGLKGDPGVVEISSNADNRATLDNVGKLFVPEITTDPLAWYILSKS